MPTTVFMEGLCWREDLVVWGRSAPHSTIDPGICLTSTALTTAHSNIQFSVDIPAKNPAYSITLIRNVHSQRSVL